MNFKVLCIGRERDVIVTCFVGAFFNCIAFTVEWGVLIYKWLISNDTCFGELHKLGYLYIYCRVILCGSLVVGMFVWASCKVKVCLVVFLVRLVAQ